MVVSGNDTIDAASSRAVVTASPGGADPVDESHREGLVGADGSAGQDEVECAGLADQPGESGRATVDQRDPPAPTEHAEHGVRRGDTKVAPQRELEAPSHRVTLDGRHHDEFQIQPCRTHGAVFRAFQTVDVGPVRDGVEVCSGAEGSPGAGEHGRVDLGVLIEFDERLLEQVRGRAVHRVASIRAIDGHDRDGPETFDVYGHGRTSTRTGRYWTARVTGTGREGHACPRW
jgi:hypothetical protein